MYEPLIKRKSNIVIWIFFKNFFYFFIFSFLKILSKNFHKKPLLTAFELHYIHNFLILLSITSYTSSLLGYNISLHIYYILHILVLNFKEKIFSCDFGCSYSKSLLNIVFHNVPNPFYFVIIFLIQLIS